MVEACSFAWPTGCAAPSLCGMLVLLSYRQVTMLGVWCKLFFMGDTWVDIFGAGGCLDKGEVLTAVLGVPIVELAGVECPEEDFSGDSL